MTGCALEMLLYCMLYELLVKSEIMKCYETVGEVNDIQINKLCFRVSVSELDEQQLVGVCLLRFLTRHHLLMEYFKGIRIMTGGKTCYNAEAAQLRFRLHRVVAF